MKILLVKPYPELLVARRLQKGFLHLEPLELEIVAAGPPPEEDIKILDLSTEKKPLKSFRQTLDEFLPDLVGFSGYSTNVDVVKNLARITKQEHPKTTTLVGGIHATLLPADYNTPYIDLIGRGEGAVILKNIVKRFKDNQPLHDGKACLS